MWGNGGIGALGRRQMPSDRDLCLVLGEMGQAYELERSRGGFSDDLGACVSIGANGRPQGFGASGSFWDHGGVDEIQWQHGHKYLTVVYQINEGCKRLLWSGKGRTEETLKVFFSFFGEERSAALQFICSDMWKPYLNVIAEKAKDALNILDRYHIMAKISKAIDKVRAGEARKLREEGYDPVLKYSRWCLLKRPENRTEKEDSKLADLLRYNLKTVRSYLLKEEFQRFWEYFSPYWAGRFLEKWCTKVMRSRIEPMKEIARTLRSHSGLIMNWFKARNVISLGAVEGLNNKVKVVTRKSYGFKHAEVLEIALFHTLGKLPERDFTHKFC